MLKELKNNGLWNNFCNFTFHKTSDYETFKTNTYSFNI